MNLLNQHLVVVLFLSLYITEVFCLLRTERVHPSEQGKSNINYRMVKRAFS